MDSTPRQPKLKNDEPGHITPVQWLKQTILTPQESAITSIGEFLIPTLLAAMETCWIDAIFIWLAGIHIFNSSEPLMPFWAPFILIAGSQWLLLYAEQGTRSREPAEETEEKKAHGNSANGLYIGAILIVAVFLIWLHVYAQKAFVLDPRWILDLSNDVLLLNLNFFQMVAIIVLSFLFGWRGIRLLQLEVEPYHVFRELGLGLGIIIAVIVLRAGQESGSNASLAYDTTLLLLIPIFLFLSLSAHALACGIYTPHAPGWIARQRCCARKGYFHINRLDRGLSSVANSAHRRSCQPRGFNRYTCGTGSFGYRLSVVDLGIRGHRRRYRYSFLLAS
jgi:hypothetical protein